MQCPLVVLQCPLYNRRVHCIVGGPVALFIILVNALVAGHSFGRNALVSELCLWSAGCNALLPRHYLSCTAQWWGHSGHCDLAPTNSSGYGWGCSSHFGMNADQNDHSGSFPFPIPPCPPIWKNYTPTYPLIVTYLFFSSSFFAHRLLVLQPRAIAIFFFHVSVCCMLTLETKTTYPRNQN